MREKEHSEDTGVDVR